jgi:hypothetical protein
MFPALASCNRPIDLKIRAKSTLHPEWKPAETAAIIAAGRAAGYKFVTDERVDREWRDLVFKRRKDRYLLYVSGAPFLCMEAYDDTQARLIVVVDLKLEYNALIRLPMAGVDC